MRLGHDGLIALAKTKKIDINELKPGEALIFINTKRDRMKCFAWNKVVSFVRSVDINRPIDVGVLDYLAQAFNENGVMDYPRALKEALEDKLKGKKLEPEMLSSKTARAILQKARR